MSPRLNIPIASAIAVAVILWSPVIITGIIPARRASFTACTASGRGGSIIDIRPIKIKSFSFSKLSGSWHSLYAKARTRWPFLEKTSFCCFIEAISLLFILRTPSLSRIKLQRSNSTSTAPFVRTVGTL